jgi:hypothetical protein
VMDCGHNAALDQSRWSPGVSVGKPIELSDNCYPDPPRQGSGCCGTPAAPMPWPILRDLPGQGQPRGLGAGRSSPRSASSLPTSMGRRVAYPRRPCRQCRCSRRRPFSSRRPSSTSPSPPTSAVPARRPPRARGRSRRFRRRRRHHPVDAGAPGAQSQRCGCRTGWVVLSGDLTHFRDNWENAASPR